MYIRLSIIFQLIFMSISYFFIVIALWTHMKSFVFLFAMIPLVVNILVFSHVVLNYVSILVFSFLALYIIRVPFDYIFYEFDFWGVQGVLLSIAIAISLIRRLLIPSLPTDKNKWTQQFILSTDNIIVEYDANTGIITHINGAACRLYGWNKKDLLRHSLMLIHPINFLTNPPYEFMDRMKQKRSWHGFLPIINKQGMIFEERAVYSPVFDPQKRLVRIEKRVIEAIYKHDFKENHDMYHYFFVSLDMPVALIDYTWKIDEQNHIFSQKIGSHHPSSTQLLDMFAKDIHHKLIQALQQSFNGKKTSFITEMKDYGFTLPVKLLFLPYQRQNITTQKALKVFLILEELSKIDSSEEIINDSKKIINLSPLLKDILLQIRQMYHDEMPIRLFSSSLPNIYSAMDIWCSLFLNLLLLAARYGTAESDSITISCSTSFNIHYFKVKYQGISYETLSSFFGTHINSQTTPLEVKKIQDALSYLGIAPVVIPGNDNISVLCFNFKE
ncbi:MAG: PAS domain-containing protein [Brevinema sp.]